VLLLAHPRLRVRAAEHGVDLGAGSLRTLDPAPYPATVQAVLAASGVITDSGGLQKEAYLLDRPCTTLRSETEWEETLADGWNVLVPDPAGLVDAVARPAPTAPRGTPFGDGHAAAAVLDELETASR